MKINVVITSRIANVQDEELTRNSKKIEDLDEGFSKVYVNLNELKIFILDSNLSNKFGMLADEDYVFLNNLFLNEKYFQSKDFRIFYSLNTRIRKFE